MRRTSLFVLMIAVAGCEPSQIQLPQTAPLRSAVQDSPVAVRGTRSVQGRVVWQGPQPVVAPILWPVNQTTHQELPNPNAPKISPDGGLAGAVVWLEGENLACSAPWPHPAVQVQLNERGITVKGGRTGFVRRGDTITITAKEGTFGVRGRGADVFATILTLGQTRFEWRCEKPGRIALSTASHQFWASADLFVMEHSFITITDANGYFRFDQVPEGACRAVAYHPNWKIQATETDPEIGTIARQKYQAPLQQTRAVPATGAVEFVMSGP